MALSMGDILRVTYRHKYLSIHDHINVTHYIYDTPATPNDETSLLEDIAFAAGEAWGEIASILSSRLDAIDIAVYNVSDDTPIGTTSFGAGYTGGTAAGDGMPFSDAALCLAYTSVKRRIGKVYVGGMLESSQTDGLLSGEAIADLGAFHAALMRLEDGPNESILKYIVYSREGGTWSLPTVRRIQPIIASQDRRKQGRGS